MGRGRREPRRYAEHPLAAGTADLRTCGKGIFDGNDRRAGTALQSNGHDLWLPRSQPQGRQDFVPVLPDMLPPKSAECQNFPRHSRSATSTCPALHNADFTGRSSSLFQFHYGARRLEPLFPALGEFWDSQRRVRSRSATAGGEITQRRQTRATASSASRTSKCTVHLRAD